MWWKIYYDDNTTFSSEDGSPFDAPRTGVQVIAYEDQLGRYWLMSQADYYYYEPGRPEWGWWHADMWAIFDHLQRAKQPLVLFGRMMTFDNFTDIEKRALAELPGKKHGWRRNGPTSTGEVTSD